MLPVSELYTGQLSTDAQFEVDTSGGNLQPHHYPLPTTHLLQLAHQQQTPAPALTDRGSAPHTLSIRLCSPSAVISHLLDHSKYWDHDNPCLCSQYDSNSHACYCCFCSTEALAHSEPPATYMNITLLHIRFYFLFDSPSTAPFSSFDLRFLYCSFSQSCFAPCLACKISHCVCCLSLPLLNIISGPLGLSHYHITRRDWLDGVMFYGE